MFKKFLTAGAIALAAVAGLALPAQAEDGKAMLVLDASGSMWGQVDGVAKIEIARQQIDTLLADWQSGTQLGVMAYGHREKGNCADIETVVPVGAVDRARYMGAVNALKPKGKTPISAAVRQAAAQLKHSEERATIVLLSDGLETCQADPCAVAQELEEAGLDFQIHVVGFDLKAEEQASLRCLAENTGGRFFTAGNANELNTAFAEARKTIIAAPEPEKEAGPQGIKVVSVLAEGEAPLEKDVFYWVYEGEADLEGKRKEVTRSGAAAPLFKLAPGAYRVVAGYGKARASADLTVEAGALTTATLVLNAGHLRVRSVATEGVDPLEKDVFYWLYEAQADLEGKRKEVARNGAANALFRVPAGEYMVVSGHGKARASAMVTVTPAQLTQTVLDLNVGYIRATSIPVAGADPLDKDVFYWLYEAQADLEGKHKEVDRNGAATALFRVPAGTYRLVSGHGKARSTQDVTVTANQLTEVTLDLNVGYVRARTALSAEDAPLEKGVFYWVYEDKTDLNGQRKEVDRNGAATALFRLPAGRYVLQSRYGGANAYARQTIEVTAGQLQEITLSAEAGTVRAKVAPAAGGDPIADNSRVFWWVYEAEADIEGKRKEVARNGQATALLNLAAGDYMLVVKADNTRVSQEISVTAGEIKDVVLTLP